MKNLILFLLKTKHRMIILTLFLKAASFEHLQSKTHLSASQLNEYLLQLEEAAIIEQNPEQPEMYRLLPSLKAQLNKMLIKTGLSLLLLTTTTLIGMADKKYNQAQNHRIYQQLDQ